MTRLDLVGVSTEPSLVPSAKETRLIVAEAGEKVVEGGGGWSGWR